jgi:hypothetical protein
MKIESNYLILDVIGRGRHRLAKKLKPLEHKVIITGYINGQYGDDDGTSIEFNVTVTSVTGVC